VERRAHSSVICAASDATSPSIYLPLRPFIPSPQASHFDSKSMAHFGRGLVPRCSTMKPSTKSLAPRWLRKLWADHPLAVASGVVVLALASAVGLLWPLTDVIAAHDVGLITGAKRAPALQAARAVARTQLLTLGAGVFAAGVLIFTARNFTLTRRTVELQRQTFELTEEGQVTDRYTKAIEELGSDKLDVRIGGIYALERIARDSARDHPTVMDVLAAFVREHSREQWPLPEPGTDARDAARDQPTVVGVLAAFVREKLREERPPPAPGRAVRDRTTRPDVQAAITVIGRRNARHDRGLIDLRRAVLPGADLPDACLTHAVLVEADLSGAGLIGADLSEASLVAANFTGAYLTGAHLTGASVVAADFAGAHLDFALWPSYDVPDGWKRDPDSGRLEPASEEPGEAPPGDA
jgi:Pentapeptide repeats (8 copies)